MSRLLILIAGIPGSGKTTFGNWLKNEFAFYHFDMEEDLREIHELRDKWGDGWHSGDYHAFLSHLRQFGENVVITWGFPEQAVHLARHGANLGLISFWFDGNRNISRQHWLRRERMPLDYSRECYFDHLVGQVSSSDIEDVFRRRMICAVTDEGHVNAEVLFAQHILPEMDTPENNLNC